MKQSGTELAGIEVGNAWDLREPGSKTNWIIGHGPSIPTDSLRSMPQNRKADRLSVKWFEHDPEEDKSEWGTDKGPIEEHTFSVLANDGEFELTFFKAENPERYMVTLDRPGDFVIWGPKLWHSWRPLKFSRVVTCRWTPL